MRAVCRTATIASRSAPAPRAARRSGRIPPENDEFEFDSLGSVYTVHIPEPGALALLASGLLVIVRRRQAA